jgi:hypothetical protein
MFVNFSLRYHSSISWRRSWEPCRSWCHLLICIEKKNVWSESCVEWRGEKLRWKYGITQSPPLSNLFLQFSVPLSGGAVVDALVFVPYFANELPSLSSTSFFFLFPFSFFTPLFLVGVHETACRRR